MEKGRARALPEMLTCARAMPGVALQQRQGGHAAHRIADHAGQPVDAQAAHDFGRCVGHVLDRQLGEVEPVGLAAGWMDRGRAGGALAAAQRVDADHEPAPGVDRPARAEHRLPPARCRIGGAGGGVGVGRQAGEDQHGIAGRRIQTAPGFVGDARAVQGAAALDRERRGQGVETRAGRDEFVGGDGSHRTESNGIGAVDACPGAATAAGRGGERRHDSCATSPPRQSPVRSDPGPAG